MTDTARSLVERLRELQLRLCDDDLGKSCDCADAKLLREAADQIEADAARIKQLETALMLILAEPYGCPMCDSGKLRDPQKQHWDSCGFARAASEMEVSRCV